MTVVDAITGERLPGSPSEYLVLEAKEWISSMPLYARKAEGVWWFEATNEKPGTRAVRVLNDEGVDISELGS